MDQRLPEAVDWPALCAELAAELERCRPLAEVPPALARARAALAAEPVAEGPSLEEVEDLCEEHCFNVEGYESIECLQGLINDALARWGRPALAAAAGLCELADDLREQASQGYCEFISREDLRRAAELLERQAAPVPVLPEDAQVIEPSEHTLLVPVPVPVAVSERLPGVEDCDAEGQVWAWDYLAERWGLWPHESIADGFYHWLPAHAFPLPAGEVGS